MNAIGANFSHRFFIARVAAVFGIVALMLFSFGAIAHAQQEIADEEEIVFEEEEVIAEDDSSFVEAPADADLPADRQELTANETEDEGGFFDVIGDFFGEVKDAVVDVATGAYDAATDFLGLGDEEEEAEEEEPPVVVDDEEVMLPEDTDVEEPTAAPKTNAFTLRVSIAERDIAAVLAAGQSEDAIRYEPRSFEIPERGLLTLRATQDGPLFCLAFDISEFRVAAKLADASFEVNGVKGAVEVGDVNAACVELSALSATASLVIEEVFE